jgi:hypothetical protein
MVKKSLFSDLKRLYNIFKEYLLRLILSNEYLKKTTFLMLVNKFEDFDVPNTLIHIKAWVKNHFRLWAKLRLYLDLASQISVKKTTLILS